MSIKEEDLVQINRGRRQRFFPGDKVSRLTILDFVGKKYIPSEDSYDPVYRCVCECGNETLLSQQYCETRRELKQCGVCSKEHSIRKCKSIWAKKKKKKEVALTARDVFDLWKPPG